MPTAYLDPNSKAYAQREAFVNEYCVDFNAGRAALRLGFGSNIDSCYQIGFRYLHDDWVQREIRRRRKLLCDKYSVTSERIVAELAKIGFSDIRDVTSWDDDGMKLIPSARLEKRAARAIAEISETPTQHGRVRKVKLHDKIAALQKLGQRLGIFEADGRPQQGGEYTLRLKIDGVDAVPELVDNGETPQLVSGDDDGNDPQP